MPHVETITAKVDAAARIPQDRMQTVVAAPKSIKIELTSRCNLGCKYCAQPGRDGGGMDIDEKVLDTVIDGAVAAGVSEFGLFYLGEPFMAHELLCNTVMKLKHRGAPYVFLTSNATIAASWQVKKLMACGLDSLKWSVNAASASEFEAMCGRPGKVWTRALENIRAAHQVRSERGYATRLYASSIRYPDQTDERSAAMQKLVDEHIRPYVDEHYWLPLYTMGSGGDKVVGDKSYTPTAGNQGRADAPVAPLPCWSLFTVAHVMVDGRMTACCFDADGKWVVGDLKTHSFMDCWNSPAFQRLREAHLKRDVSGTACESCAMSRKANA